ncbi:hypothetical protein M5G24_29640 [Pseudomonas sp. TNT2022 ID1048]|uniref:hypothetical protein n=1 Tax=Pseudomonas idahonensis TaxID=2942628 RepID=UPI00235EDD05|nr:hypothetical protein [Pseudomonas idahonensis]MDD1023179.1 hypothetical protein [Pseudomonas idahonensis]
MAQNDPATLMMEATLQGFKNVKDALDVIQNTQKIQAKATYKGLTGSGKSRYVTEMAEQLGSQVKVAEMLDLTRGRINQLVKSEKNRANGK